MLLGADLVYVLLHAKNSISFGTDATDGLSRF